MKANELRIGNLLIDVEDRICKVERIYENDWTAYSIKGAITTGTPRPIPLTEEILLKCGATKRGTNFWLGEDCVIWKTFREFLCIYIDRFEDGLELDVPIYLHQLQNLYFALTGKEIDISL